MFFVCNHLVVLVFFIIYVFCMYVFLSDDMWQLKPMYFICVLSNNFPFCSVLFAVTWVIVFGVSNCDECQPNVPADIRSIVSHFRVSPADKISLGRAR